MRIGVVGLGYVGIANYFLLAQKNMAIGYDIDPDKVEKLSKNICPIDDKYVQSFLEEERVNLNFTNDISEVFKFNPALSCQTDYMQRFYPLEKKYTQGIYLETIK